MSVNIQKMNFTDRNKKVYHTSSTLLYNSD